jgi:hypothetical protein
MSHGELWRRQYAIGLETVAGTAVPATRRIYLQDSDIGDSRDSTAVEFDTGDVNRVRAVTLGPTQAGGSANLLMSADELIEWGLVGYQSGVVAVAVSGETGNQMWSFVPSTALSSLTLERDDGARTFKMAGVRVNQFTFSGDATGAATVGLDLFGVDYTTLGAFASVAQRSITYMQGYQMLFYVDAFGTATWGATAGVAPTLIAGTLLNYQVTVGRNLSRVYTADNTLAANATIVGPLTVNATYTFKAAATPVTAELTAYGAETQRLVRVRHVGPASEAGMFAGSSRTVDIDVAGKWSARTLSGDAQGVATYEFTLIGVYDSVNALTTRMRLKNARTTAW